MMEAKMERKAKQQNENDVMSTAAAGCLHSYADEQSDDKQRL
jgi:hypothetical protein